MHKLDTDEETGQNYTTKYYLQGGLPCFVS